MQLESLEELRVFTQIVESGSLSGAAKVLGLPANTVSRRLSALEERLDTRLVHRTTRSMSLSESGRAFLAGAQRILQEVEAAEGQLRVEREGLHGTIKLGVPSVLTKELLGALPPLMRENPGLRVQLRVHDKPVNPVTEGLDVLIMGGSFPDSNLIVRSLGRVRMVLAASPAYLDRCGRPTRPTDLEGHTTLHFASDPPQTSWVLTAADGTQHVVPVEGHFEANDGRAMMDAAEAGLGICATSERYLRRTQTLERVLPEHSAFSFPINAVYPASGQRSARLQAVVEALRVQMMS